MQLTNELLLRKSISFSIKNSTKIVEEFLNLVEEQSSPQHVQVFHVKTQNLELCSSKFRWLQKIIRQRLFLSPQKLLRWYGSFRNFCPWKRHHKFFLSEQAFYKNSDWKRSKFFNTTRCSKVWKRGWFHRGFIDGFIEGEKLWRSFTQIGLITTWKMWTFLRTPFSMLTKLISLFKKTKRFTIVIATFWVRSLSQENKKIYYCDCYIFGQVVEASNWTDYIDTYILIWLV